MVTILRMSRAREVEADVDLLRERFYIDPSSPSGLRFKKASKTGRRNQDDAAGYFDSGKGYSVDSNRTKIKVHRIVWILSNGSIPDGLTIDHKNGVPSDNRIENLQLMTPSANNRARNRLSKRNKSTYVGVIWHKYAHKWMAVCHREKRLHLGYFNSPIRAARAYNAAVIKYAKEHGETPRYLNPV